MGVKFKIQGHLGVGKGENTLLDKIVQKPTQLLSYASWKNHNGRYTWFSSKPEID